MGAARANQVGAAAFAAVQRQILGHDANQPGALLGCFRGKRHRLPEPSEQSPHGRAARTLVQEQIARRPVLPDLLDAHRLAPPVMGKKGYTPANAASNGRGGRGYGMS